jgi:hypothetical protein
MRYVLTDGELYRQADGQWTEGIDRAERFSWDAAVVRRDELAAAGQCSRIVETHGRSRKASEAMVARITRSLDAIERAWEGKTIGIGYECDVEAGRVNLTFEPEGEPEHAVTVHVDIADIVTGTGDEN